MPGSSPSCSGRRVAARRRSSTWSGALDVPTSGRVVIDGRDITGASRRELFAYRRATVAFIFQTFNLFPGPHRASRTSSSASTSRTASTTVARGREGPARRRTRRSTRSFPEPALGRRAATRRDRARTRHRQPPAARRRADRRARLPNRCPDPRAAARAGPIRYVRDDRHAQPGDLSRGRPRHRARAAVASCPTDRPRVAQFPCSRCAGRPVQRLRSLLRWSARDLRSRWLQVAGIALIIGIGSGFYSGLLSTSAWRSTSYAASYRVTQDVRLTRGAQRAEATPTRRRCGRQLPRSPTRTTSRPHRFASMGRSKSTRRRARARCSSRVQSWASTSRTVGRRSATLAVLAGRNLRASDRGKPVVVLDRHFGSYYNLPAQRSDHHVGRSPPHLRRAGPHARQLRRARRAADAGDRGRLRGDVHVARDRAAPARTTRQGQRPHATRALARRRCPQVASELRRAIAAAASGGRLHDEHASAGPSSDLAC